MPQSNNGIKRLKTEQIRQVYGAGGDASQPSTSTDAVSTPGNVASVDDKSSSWMETIFSKRTMILIIEVMVAAVIAWAMYETSQDSPKHFISNTIVVLAIGTVVMYLTKSVWQQFVTPSSS